MKFKTMSLFLITKICIKCGEEKSIDCFYARKDSKDGYRSNCIRCHENRRAELLLDPNRKEKAILQHRESGKKYAKKFRQKFSKQTWYRERKKECDKRSYVKNKATRSAYHRERYFEHKNEIKERVRLWRLSNKDKKNHHEATRRARINGTFTLKEWIGLCNYYMNICLCCGASKKLTRDHVNPISKNGLNTIINIQPLCLECNSSKGTKNIDFRNKVLQGQASVLLTTGEIITGYLIDMMKVGIPKISIVTTDNKEIRINPNDVMMMDLKQPQLS